LDGEAVEALLRERVRNVTQLILAVNLGSHLLQLVLKRPVFPVGMKHPARIAGVKLEQVFDEFRFDNAARLAQRGKSLDRIAINLVGRAGGGWHARREGPGNIFVLLAHMLSLRRVRKELLPGAETQAVNAKAVRRAAA